MAEHASPKRIVKLDNVRKNSIVITDLGEKLKETVFSQEFKKATQIIEGVLEENRSTVRKDDYPCRECKSRDCRACRNRNHTACQDKRKPKHPTEFRTAIPFIGDRGTGKTSVMYSVLMWLKKYCGQNPDAAFNLNEKFDSTRFITLDMIDANTLKSTEDVMEIILSKMMTYLEEFEPDHDFRELYRQMDELHEAMLRIDSDRRQDPDSYGLMALQKVADSQQAINGFRDLVAEFCRTISVCKYNGNPCCLVVALDDIDMYQGSTSGMYNSQFALMEYLYNYMRIPNMIVLLTYNENILKRSCNRHFNRIYFGKENREPVTPTECHDIEKLTGQFMSKMFPQHQRIYLPNFRFIDSANRSNMYVNPILGEGSKKEILDPFTTEDEIPVKEFMLRLISHKTGVCFDAAGTKEHFFEPRNLRSFGELFDVIYSMEKIDEKSEEPELVRSRNRQTLLSYMYNQFALRHLNAAEYERFQKLAVLPIERQHRTMVDLIRERRMEIDVDNFGGLAETENYRWRYSYGELLHNIYFSTRIGKSDKNDETYFSKDFMHCIFGSHSVLLNNIARDDNSRKNILKVVGSSVAGRWANEMLPKVYHEDYNNTARIGSISLPIRDYFGWELPKEISPILLAMGTDQEWKKANLENYLIALIMMGMFFTGYPADGLGIYIDAALDEDKGSVLKMASDSEDHICFNVMNFVINSYNALPVDSEKRKTFLNNPGPEQVYEGNPYIPYICAKLRKLGENLGGKLTDDWNKKIEDATKELRHIKEMRNKEGINPLAEKTWDRTESLTKKNIERAKAWKDVIAKVKKTNKDGISVVEFDPQRFKKEWDDAVFSAVKRVTDSIQKWEENHKTQQFVMPVQHFDMMYNIVKRLANVSYYDIPKEARVSRVFEYYLHLYDNIEQELKKQDDVYGTDRSESFAAAFRDSVFLKVLTAKPDEEWHNAFIWETVTSMVQSTIPAQQDRARAFRFDADLIKW